MTYVQGPNLKKWFDEHVRGALGPNPTSTSPQPVHVINGFFHTAMTGRRMTRFGANMVASKNDVWQISQEQLRDEAAHMVDLPKTDSALDDLRRAIESMTATDGAVFLNNHSFQVAHIGLTSSDTVQFGLGSLAASLVLDDDPTKRLLRASVERLKEPQPNPHWGLQRALVDESTSQLWKVVEVSDPPPRWAKDDATRALAQSTTALLRRCLELLSGGCDSLLALQLLANACTWVGLLAYSQVPALTLSGAVKPLLLECTSPGDCASIRETSATALKDLHNQFEAWLAISLERTIRAEYGSDLTDVGARTFLNTTEPYSLSGGVRNAQDNVLVPYSAYRREHEIVPSLAFTVRDLLISGMGNKHRSWFHAVGRHCGFVGPRRGKTPRIRAEVSLLPTLVLAGMPDETGPGLLMSQWTANLEARFGLVVGPSPLARSMDPQATEEDLEFNQRELGRVLASVGLARRYSDGVTEIFDPRTLWVAQ